jgi:hypothetical protein
LAPRIHVLGIVSLRLLFQGLLELVEDAVCIIDRAGIDFVSVLLREGCLL